MGKYWCIDLFSMNFLSFVPEQTDLVIVYQGSHRLEKDLKIGGFLEKSLKTKSALKSTGESLLELEKSLNFTIFCRT